MVVGHKAEILKSVTETGSMRIVPVSHLASSSPSLSKQTSHEKWNKELLQNLLEPLGWQSLIGAPFQTIPHNSAI